MGSEEEMIHDHNDKKLGGPNADVIERIKAMKGPKLVQAQPGYGMEPFPPKHLYEPVTDERRAEIIKALEGEPMPDYSHTITTTGAIPDFGEKRKVL